MTNSVKVLAMLFFLVGATSLYAQNSDEVQQPTDGDVSGSNSLEKPSDKNKDYKGYSDSKFKKGQRGDKDWAKICEKIRLYKEGKEDVDFDSDEDKGKKSRTDIDSDSDGDKDDRSYKDKDRGRRRHKKFRKYVKEQCEAINNAEEETNEE